VGFRITRSFYEMTAGIESIWQSYHGRMGNIKSTEPRISRERRATKVQKRHQPAEELHCSPFTSGGERDSPDAHMFFLFSQMKNETITLPICTFSLSFFLATSQDLATVQMFNIVYYQSLSSSVDAVRGYNGVYKCYRCVWSCSNRRHFGFAHSSILIDLIML
jgi:hypothetical protein